MATFDLATLLIRALEQNRDQVNEAAERNPGEPIQAQLDWHPQQRKVELVLRPSLRTAPYRVDT